jgi:hypothetical protein
MVFAFLYKAFDIPSGCGSAVCLDWLAAVAADRGTCHEFQLGFGHWQRTAAASARHYIYYIFYSNIANKYAG